MRARKADRRTKRTGHALHIALNSLKLETSVKDSIKGKRQRAGWNDDYMLTVLLAGATLN